MIDPTPSPSTPPHVPAGRSDIVRAAKEGTGVKPYPKESFWPDLLRVTEGRAGPQNLGEELRRGGYGAFDYVTQPFDVDHLVEVVEAAFL